MLKEVVSGYSDHAIYGLSDHWPLITDHSYSMRMSPDPVRRVSNGPPPRTLPWIDLRVSCTRPCTVIVIGAPTSSVPELVEICASKAALAADRPRPFPDLLPNPPPPLCIPSS